MKQETLYDVANKQLEDKIATLPISLTVSEVADFLSISRSSAYNLVKKPDFPKKRIKGMRTYIIPKIKFLEWYLSVYED